MQRYFVPEENWQQNEVVLTDNDYHHIKNVMRLGINDSIICVHPDGQVALCSIQHIGDSVVEATITDWQNEEKELPVSVTIAQGLPKKNKLELILQKGTELGGHQFQLYQADRSIVQWDIKKAEQKLQRYRKIVKEASEQCHRNHIPVIEANSDLKDILKQKDNYDIILFAYEEEAKRESFSSFSNVLKKCKTGDHICICIGPEGGFSAAEVELLLDYGAIPVRLGPRILRTETASMYALASISYHFEELRCK